MTGGLRLRNATLEDRGKLHELAAETPGMTFPEDLFAWPTIEIALVEDEAGEILGFGYVEAIPEGHFVFSRKATDHATRQHGMMLLKFAAESVLERLNLPLMRCPASPELRGMVEWAKTLPNMAMDSRVPLLLARPRRA